MTLTAPPPSPTIDDVRRSIDALVGDAQQYRATKEFRELIQFAARFRHRKPFNALLIHTQMPGAQFVAPAHRWEEHYGRRVRFGERPILTLQPFGPVMFVYDVSQTEPLDDDPRELPLLAVNSFAMPPMRGVAPVLAKTLRNAIGWGVRITFVPRGSTSAGCITWSPGGTQEVPGGGTGSAPRRVPVRFQAAINANFSDTERYVTVAHELAHLFCGHLGTPNQKWWPDRRRVDDLVAEFEAETVAYLVCQRVDADVAMPPYLDGYLTENGQVPDGISLERILTVAGRIIDLGEKRVQPPTA